MHSIEEHIDEQWNHLKKATLFVACSGGLDSVVLVFILHKLNFNLHVLHVNYQLRGEDSEKDARFVIDFCQQNKIPYSIKTIDLGKQLADGGNLQELAREVRYSWFQEQIEDAEEGFIAVAHHQDDQIETFFLNLSRNAGVMGLASMLEQNEKIIRPFLPFSRKEIHAYAIENKIYWREDVSNKSNKYRRNALRNLILPLLSAKIPSLKESVLILIEQFQQKQVELERKIEKIIAEINNKQSLSISIYKNWDELERIEFFRQLNEPFSKVEQLNAILNAENGKKIVLEKNVLFKEIVKVNEDLIFVLRDKIEKEFHLVIQEVKILPQTFSKREIYLDASKIKGELMLRKWQIGDRIKPVGMKGSKLISDCIKDAHVPIAEKEDVLVLCDDENIHWCLGITVGRLAIANQETTMIKKVKVVER